MAKQKNSTNDGKEAEGHFRDTLLTMRQHYRTTFIRLYDTTSTGAKAYIPEAPGDFIFLRNSISVLVEVKSSEKHLSLKDITLRGFIRENQFMGARMWSIAGGFSIFVFYSLESKMFEVWAGKAVVEAMLNKHRLKCEPIASCKKVDLLNVLIELTN